MERIIYSDDYSFEDWCKDTAEDCEYEQELTHENYCDYMAAWFCDEKCNLDIEVDGVIVAFANLGLWDGIHKGAKVVGTNVNEIFSIYEDINKYYVDRYNVKSEHTHHDGKHNVLYRVAKDMAQAERLVHKIAYEDMTIQQFCNATKSLRPYVAQVYGW